jgi:hypothetical protein
MGAREGFAGRTQAGFPTLADQVYSSEGFSTNRSKEITLLKEQTSQMASALEAITQRLDAMLKKPSEFS